MIFNSGQNFQMLGTKNTMMRKSMIEKLFYVKYNFQRFYKPIHSQIMNDLQLFNHK